MGTLKEFSRGSLMYLQLFFLGVYAFVYLADLNRAIGQSPTCQAQLVDHNRD